MIFRQGDPALIAFYVETGAVEIVRRINGRDVVVDIVRTGQFFGEIALLDGGERSATARAIDYTVCVPVTKDVFEERMTAADPFVQMIVQMLCGYIRRYGQLAASRRH